VNDWTRGYDIGRLKALTRPFKAAHKPFVFGAFGLTKERDVAEAIADDSLLVIGEEPEAAAIGSFVRSNSQPLDFAGNPITLFRGSRFMVRAFAALSAAGADRLLAAVRHRAEPSATYCEVFEEDLAAKAALARARYLFLGTKVLAGGEIKGVYAAPWSYPWSSPFERSYAPEEAASLEIVSPGFVSPYEQGVLLKEASERGAWTQHYSSYNKRKSWTSFALRGYSDDPSFIIKPSEMAKSWKSAHPELLAEKPRWTHIAERFPGTLKALQRLGAGLDFDRVRFMRLAAGGGELTRHADVTDREAGVQPGKVMRLHVPLKTSPAVRFSCWGHRGARREISLPARALCYLDQRKPHAVVNPSSEERIHLVVDVRSTDELRTKVKEAYVARSASLD
jgi:hypothetical protein